MTSLDEGKVMIGYEDNLGELHFRNEDLRVKYKTELGRYMKMDLNPSVEKTSWGLDALRKASMAQVTLDHDTARMNITDKESQFFQNLLCYGMGVLAHSQKKSAMGASAPDVEVVPSWEMLPFPANPTSNYEVRGHMRNRKVPLAWLKDKQRKTPNCPGLSITHNKGW